MKIFSLITFLGGYNISVQNLFSPDLLIVYLN